MDSGNNHEPVQSPASPAASPAAQQPGATSVPAVWPGAFKLYGFSSQAVKINVWTILALYVVSFLPVLIPTNDNAILNNIVINVASTLLQALLSVALARVLLASVRGRKLGFGNSLSMSLRLFLEMLALNILTGLAIVISLLLFIIPFFFVAPRLVLVNYYLVDQNTGIFGAWQASWNATKGHVLKVYGIAGVAILMSLVILTILGIPIALYLLLMYSASTAILYEYVRKVGPKIAANEKPQAPISSPAAQA